MGFLLFKSKTSLFIIHFHVEIEAESIQTWSSLWVEQFTDSLLLPAPLSYLFFTKYLEVIY